MDYQKDTFNNYIKTTAMDDDLIGTVIKLGVYFVLGLCLMGALCLVVDKRKQARKA